MSEDLRERTFSVDQNHHGWRLDAFLAARIRRLSRSAAARIIRGGGVRLVPERRARPASTVRQGDTVVLRQHLESELLQYDALRVLLQTPAFVAIDKPAGMLVHPTATAFRNTVMQWATDVGGFPEACVVHRLDRETSGVMIFARGPAHARRLSAAFASPGAVLKRYLAIALDPQARYAVGDHGTIDIPLGFDETSVLPRLVMGRGTLSALTHWRCVQRGVGTGSDLALLEVEIAGGRQHQIRAHLALVGTPIVGDKLYAHGAEYYLDWVEGRADRSVLRCDRQALHASELELEDEGVRHVLCAPPPQLYGALLSGTPTPCDAKSSASGS